MNIPFTSEQTDKLLSFIGYGNLDAPVWFIGMEEGGGGEENLRRRLKFEQIEDLKRAHQILGITKHHFPPFKLQPTWGTMCKIMLVLQGNEPSRDNQRLFQANKLGRFGGKTFLPELLPLPSPGKNKWGYEKLFPDFSKRRDYEDVVRPDRISLLKKIIIEHQPHLTICYGKGDWDHYRLLFPDVSWKKEGPFLQSMHANTFVFLTPHFVSHQMGNVRINLLCEKIISLSKEAAK